MNKLNEEILAKFLMGECTEDELREVNAWLEESGCLLYTSFASFCFELLTVDFYNCVHFLYIMYKLAPSGGL